MFEYAALVDAPVQRFTGIVTGPDPLDEPATPVRPVRAMARERPSVAPAPPRVPVVTDAPSRVVAPAASIDRALPTLDGDRASVQRPDRPSRGSILPTLAVVGAVALATTLWLRRGAVNNDR